jgi:hypothetical protein
MPLPDEHLEAWRVTKMNGSEADTRSNISDEKRRVGVGESRVEPFKRARIIEGVSFQRSAISGQLLNQASEHPFQRLPAVVSNVNNKDVRRWVPRSGATPSCRLTLFSVPQPQIATKGRRLIGQRRCRGTA